MTGPVRLSRRLVLGTVSVLGGLLVVLVVLVAVENPSFWSDAGISPRGIARALANDVRGRPLEGHRVWTFSPHGTPALSPLATRMLSVKELRLGLTATVGDPVPGFGGVPGTIGGDDSAWYTGLSGGTVTSVALWDTQPGPHGAATLRSLAGLGGVPASGTVSWPISVWTGYVKAGPA